MRPLSIVASGMVTGVGFSAPASCAAMRGGIDGFVETRFMFDGDWLQGCPVPFEEGWLGRKKLLEMAALAVNECLDGLPVSAAAEEIPLLLCLAEPARPGRLAGLDETLLQDLAGRLTGGQTVSHDSLVICGGRVGGVQALARAAELLERQHRRCVVVGVDSLLSARPLAAYHEQHRLLTEQAVDGFIPGEAAAAVLLANDGQSHALACHGLGFGQEPATVGSDQPLRAEGLSSAIRAALTDAGCTYADLDYRIADVSGEQYGFREASLALSRTMRHRKEDFDIWLLSEFVGQTGAAVVPLALGWAEHAARQRYAPGPGVLCQFSNDDDARGALVLHAGTQEG